jgi:hypothetical protein
VAKDRCLAASTNGWLKLIGVKAMWVADDVALEGHPLQWCDGRLCGDLHHVHLLKDKRLLTAHSDWVEHPARPHYTPMIWDATPICGTLAGPDSKRPFTSEFVKTSGSGSA